MHTCMVKSDGFHHWMEQKGFSSNEGLSASLVFLTTDTWDK